MVAVLLSVEGEGDAVVEFYDAVFEFFCVVFFVFLFAEGVDSFEAVFDDLKYFS